MPHGALTVQGELHEALPIVKAALEGGAADDIALAEQIKASRRRTAERGGAPSTGKRSPRLRRRREEAQMARHQRGGAFARSIFPAPQRRAEEKLGLGTWHCIVGSDFKASSGLREWMTGADGQVLIK
jgi:hypothetical protein